MHNEICGNTGNREVHLLEVKFREGYLDLGLL